MPGSEVRLGYLVQIVRGKGEPDLVIGRKGKEVGVHVMKGF